jgi:hypothetical protein
MAQRLTDMSLTRVSVVDKGANAKRFAILKRDEEDGVADQVTDPPPAGVLAWLRKQLGLEAEPEPVAKAQATFAAMVAGQELSDALYDSWWTLQDALWAAIYATDDAMQPLPLEAKKALVAQNLDEFKTYLLAQMETGVSKRDGGPAEAATRHIAAVVAKAGKKISGARLERLQAASEALNSVLAEVAEVTEEAGADAQEDNVEKADLVAAMTEALDPISKRLEALEKSATPAAGEDDKKPDEAPATLDDVVEVVSKLADRLEAVEKARGERTSATGQDAGEPVKKSAWAGIF